MTNTEGTAKLYRSKKDRYIAGVCGGLAQYTGIDSNLIRLLMVISAFIGGIGLIIYFAALFIVPENPDETAADSPSRMDSATFWGIVFVALGSLLLLRELDWLKWLYIDLPWTTIWALVLIGAGVALIYRQYTQEEAEYSTVEISGEKETANTQSSSKSELYRSRTDKKIGGVCGGIAKHFNVDPALIRVGWIVLTIASKGLGLLIYIVLMLILPEEPSEETVS